MCQTTVKLRASYKAKKMGLRVFCVALSDLPAYAIHN